MVILCENIEVSLFNKVIKQWHDSISLVIPA